MKIDPKLKDILTTWRKQEAIRKKSDEIRWASFSIVRHRVPSGTIEEDCPVEENAHPYSNAGIEAFETFINGFMGSLMSQNNNWFKIRLKSKGNKLEDSTLPADYGIQYTDYVTNSVMDEYHHSNFYSENNLASRDAVCGGYSCTIVQFDEKANKCFFQTLAPWRCTYDSDLMGNWNQFYYHYWLNGYQLIEKFPEVKKDEQLFKKASKGGLNIHFEMLYAICERDTIRSSETGYSLRFRKKMRFGAFDIIISENKLIRESGFTEFPVVIHVWNRNGDSQYGEGLVMKYLAEFRKLERIGYEYGIAVAKLTHGPWLIPDYMKNSFSDDPEARIIYNNTEMLPRPLGEQIDLNVALQNLMQQEQRVKHLMHNELFQYLSQSDKVFTATQVNAVKSEELSLLATIYGTVQTQKIDAIIKLTIKTMLDNGKLEYDERYIGSRSNSRFEIHLDSAMAHALETYSKSNATMGILEFLQVCMGMQITSVADIFDFDNIAHEYAFTVGAPATFYKDKKKLEEDRAEQRRIAEEQMALQNQLVQSEAERNRAGAANLNNNAGFNGGEE